MKAAYQILVIFATISVSTFAQDKESKKSFGDFTIEINTKNRSVQNVRGDYQYPCMQKFAELKGVSFQYNDMSSNSDKVERKKINKSSDSITKENK
ncbi:MAG: hypothetical protein HND52_17460 [Ignavibacteriae bacterium]|nr:hypothetical protein [Ignavibacteriota bacterium]NOG99751.1 hypothetical protein [Ignavibacteriota bacterium]